VAQDPVHFEVVGVSGANQYRTKPLELVRTVVPLTVALWRTPPPAPAAAAEAGALLGAVLLAAAAGALPWAAVLPELPQAVRTSAAAASPAAPHIFRIRFLPFTVLVMSH
jgi:hypothetical protein